MYRGKVKRRHRLFASCAIILLIIFLCGFVLDKDVVPVSYTVTDPRIPKAFDGYKIAHLSDLHCEYFGDSQKDLLDLIRAEEPDIIVLTGDIIDKTKLDYDSLFTLFDGLSEIAPVYAVSGNHECSSAKIESRMKDIYEMLGIIHLKDTDVTLRRQGAAITLFGMDYKSLTRHGSTLDFIPKIGNDSYGILLYHRSDQFRNLCGYGYGLVLAGHMHGGLIRFPFLGGVITPDRKIDFAQQFTGGMYSQDGTVLISNRGLAGSNGIPRIFNPPEAVFITLRSA